MKLVLTIRGLDESKIKRKELPQVLKVFLEEFAEAVEVHTVISENTLRTAGFIIGIESDETDEEHSELFEEEFKTEDDTHEG